MSAYVHYYIPNVTVVISAISSYNLESYRVVMNKKTKFIFFPLIIIQLIILIVLCVWIYQKQHSIVFDTRGISTLSPSQSDAQEFIKPLNTDKSVASSQFEGKIFLRTWQKRDISFYPKPRHYFLHHE